MLQLTGLRRARETWPQVMDAVDSSRDFVPPLYVRGSVRDAFAMDNFVPNFGPNGWISGRHRDYDEMRQDYNTLLNLMSITHIRVIWQRFILNLRRLIGRRRIVHHNATLMGPWIGI